MLELIRQPFRVLLMLLALFILLPFAGLPVQMDVALAAALHRSGTVSYSTQQRSNPLTLKMKAGRVGGRKT